MQIFDEVSKSDMEGIIFTYCWAFGEEKEKKYVQKIFNYFRENNGEIYVVELETDLETRLKRNKTENRIKNKTTKQDVDVSERRLLEHEGIRRLNSKPGEIKEKNYIRIDNTNISAEEAAKMIKEKFNL